MLNASGGKGSPITPDIDTKPLLLLPGIVASVVNVSKHTPESKQVFAQELRRTSNEAST